MITLPDDASPEALEKFLESDECLRVRAALRVVLNDPEKSRIALVRYQQARKGQPPLEWHAGLHCAGFVEWNDAGGFKYLTPAQFALRLIIKNR